MGSSVIIVISVPVELQQSDTAKFADAGMWVRFVIGAEQDSRASPLEPSADKAFLS